MIILAYIFIYLIPDSLSTYNLKGVPPHSSNVYPQQNQPHGREKGMSAIVDVWYEVLFVDMEVIELMVGEIRSSRLIC